VRARLDFYHAAELERERERERDGDGEREKALCAEFMTT